jgi:hypothetical protein
MDQAPGWAQALIERIAAMQAAMLARADLEALQAEMATRADLEALRAAMLTRADLEALQAEMATRADLEAVQAAMLTRADLEALRAEMATRADLEAIRADLGNLATHAELDDLNASLMRIRAELLERLEKLQKALTQQEQESVVNYATASISRETLRSLEEQLTTVTRMVMQLSRRVDKIEGRPSDH